MARKAARVLATAALLLLTSCGGYRELFKSWIFEPAEGELVTTLVFQAGDRIRVTSSKGRVIDGSFVDTEGMLFQI